MSTQATGRHAERNWVDTVSVRHERAQQRAPRRPRRSRRTWTYVHILTSLALVALSLAMSTGNL